MFKLKRREPVTKMLIASCVRDCQKEKCPMWVTLDNSYTDDKGKKITRSEGKCAIAWIPQMFIELKEVIREVGNGKKS